MQKTVQIPSDMRASDEMFDLVGKKHYADPRRPSSQLLIAQWDASRNAHISTGGPEACDEVAAATLAFCDPEPR